jgi:hypothetical protein
MDEWWTYRLSDFLLFSPHTYYRLFELYNIDVWPLHILALIFGIAIIVLIKRQPHWHGKVVSAILAACWLWVAWAYHLQHYATINWAAQYYAVGFMTQAALLIWVGIIRGALTFTTQSPVIRRVGFGIYLFALFMQPLLAPLMGRKWLQVEVFAVAPDPTALATLGVLLLAADKTHWWLLTVPIIWCVLSVATLWTMKSPEALIMALVTLIVVVTVSWKQYWLAGQSGKKE